jgi:hypothetical protein
MNAPDSSSRGLFGWRDPSTWQFLLLLFVLTVSTWLVSHMRELAGTSGGSKSMKEKPARSFDAMNQPAADLPKPRTNPVVVFNGSKQTMPEETRQLCDDASGVLRRAINCGSLLLLQDCVRHPALTIPRARAMPSSRQVIPSDPLSIGPEFGTLGDLVLTTVRLADGSDRPVVLQNTPDGFKLDWESFVGWCETDFDGLQAHADTKALPRLMRVRCQRTSARAPFLVEEGISLIISHPAEKQNLNAFVPELALRRSAASESLRRSSGDTFVLLIMPRRDTSPPGWVRVEEVVCSGWVTDR